MSVPVATLFGNKSPPILWFSNLTEGIMGGELKQSQWARLGITLQQGIQNNLAPLETISCLPPSWPSWLGTVGVLASLSASSHSLSLARQASGSLFLPITELLTGAARRWSKTAGDTLKLFQTFGLMVGMLAGYNVHLIYFCPLTWYLLADL